MVKIIKCPKCHFKQPPDTYCVQCGIDMEEFKQKPSTIFYNLLKSPFFHLSLAVLALFSFFYFSKLSFSFLTRSYSLNTETSEDLFKIDVLDVKTLKRKKKLDSRVFSKKTSSILKTKVTKTSKLQESSSHFALDTKIYFGEISELLVSEFVNTLKTLSSSYGLKIFLSSEPIRSFGGSDLYLFETSFDSGLEEDTQTTVYFPTKEDPNISVSFKWLKAGKKQASSEISIKDHSTDNIYLEKLQIPFNQILIISSFFAKEENFQSFLSEPISEVKKSELALFIEISSDRSSFK